MLETSKLFARLQDLDGHLSRKIEDWCNLALKSLKQIGKNFKQYTDHGPEHCKAMLDCLNWLIPLDTIKKLNPLEIALLLLVVYHHDIGMAWDIERQDTLMETDRDWLARKDELINKFYRSKTVIDKSDKSLLDLAFLEWARERHGEEAAHWIEENRTDKSEFQFECYYNYDPWKDVAELSKAHIMPTCDCLPVKEYIGPGGMQVNLCFLGCALRLADICHITMDRADPEVEKHIRFTDEYSRESWKVNQCIKGIGPDQQEAIVIEATPPSLAIHKAIASMGREIKVELEKTNTILLRKQSELRFPWRDVDFETHVKESGPYKYRDWEFTLDRSKVYELLMGKNLYADNSVCIRELLQNAVDAVWARWGSEAPKKGKIVCRRYERPRGDQIFEVIEVEDNGIGMDEEIIESHLLKIPGEPFYKTSRFKHEHPEAASTMPTPTAQFGIGFLSSFMVARTVEVFTRYDSPEKPAPLLHIEIDSLDKGVVYYEPVMKDSPEGVCLEGGTCVRLWLTEKLTDWTYPHKQGNWRSLKEVISYWARKINPCPQVDESGEIFLIAPEVSIPSAAAISIRDDANGISGYVDLSLSYNDKKASGMQVTVSGFYVENNPLRKELLGFWFPKGEIDFSRNRDFSLTVDRRSFANFENSKSIKRANELLAKAALESIRKQPEWNKSAKAKLRKLLSWNFVFDEHEELRETVMKLPLFQVGTGEIAAKNASILDILEKGPVYFFLPIRPIFSQFAFKTWPVGHFSKWYAALINKNLRYRYPLLHGTQMGDVQVRGEFGFKFAARSRYRQVQPLHFLPKLCDARLEFTEEGWPLVRLVPAQGTTPITGWNYLLGYEPNRRDWLICSSEGRGYWINPHPPRKAGILEEGETIVGVFVNRKWPYLISEIADGFLYPDDSITIIVDLGEGKHERREFSVIQLGDLVHPFDRIDFWIEQFCTESNLSDGDRTRLLEAFHVPEYRMDPCWISPPIVTWPEG